MSDSNQLVIPEGINYECTGCGKCCSGWSVPLTKDDYERISAIDWASKNEKFEGESLFRELKGFEKANSPYTHAIKHGDDGFCPFLVNNLCYIHSTYESKTKPSICQLFPYNFNETPSGFLSTVSFVSVGAVKNAGRPLTDQREYLESKLTEFKRLYPNHHPNWSKIELAKEVPISWEQYIELEEKMLAVLNQRQKPIKLRLAEMSLLIVEKYLSVKGGSLPSGKNVIELTSRTHPIKKADLVLLQEFYRLYFPESPISRSNMNFSAWRFALATLSYNLGLGSGLTLRLPGAAVSYKEALSIPLKLDILEDILYRFVYQRIFGKMYFGAGYGQLSIMVGFHHLVVAVVLAELQARASALNRGFKDVQEADMVITMRTLEKRLGDSALDGYAAAVLEYQLQSHGRCLRILSICDQA